MRMQIIFIDLLSLDLRTPPSPSRCNTTSLSAISSSTPSGIRKLILIMAMPTSLASGSIMVFKEIEYAFGAHEYPTTGIFEGEPKQCEGFTFKKAILIGWTEMSIGDVRSDGG